MAEAWKRFVLDFHLELAALLRRLSSEPLIYNPDIRKVEVRLPGKGKSNSHGARPVHPIITMIKWIRTSRSITNSLSLELAALYGRRSAEPLIYHPARTRPLF